MQLGSALLARWMARHAVTVTELAAVIGVSPAAISGYLADRFKPVMLVALRIEAYTDGEVSIKMWLTRPEFDALVALKPWAAPITSVA